MVSTTNQSIETNAPNPRDADAPKRFVFVGRQPEDVLTIELPDWLTAEQRRRIAEATTERISALLAEALSAGR